MTSKYKSVSEETDIDTVNRKIDPLNGWDLLQIKKEKVEVAKGEFTDKIIYILGEKYQDEDFYA